MTDLISGFAILGWMCTGAIVFGLMLISWRRAAKWVLANGAALCFFGFGVASGFVLCLTLQHERTDAVLGFCGAFVGIIAAVGGAFWVWKEQDATAIGRITTAVDVACSRLSATLAITAIDLHRNTVVESQRVAESLGAEIYRFHERVRVLEPNIAQLSELAQNAYLNLVRVLPLIQRSIKERRRILDKANGPHVQLEKRETEKLIRFIVGLRATFQEIAPKGLVSEYPSSREDIGPGPTFTEEKK